ncbi:ribonuclease T2-like protein [Vararia minispora EC-137]|uniref:Ribonuclease T2-like protein n=1 Tax=Vararia minispora EC-137 TaxID=1314806 RepID=A0ACB8QGM2_9AGAM|nr:ribonuclease T2-like protein [Vararia minispora EC-137]
MFITLALALALAQQSTFVTAASSGCPADGPISCQSSGAASCCLENPGGLILQTQFWDTNPSTGPDNSWTVHGLWPDNCDGTFLENCDSSRDYKGISSLLEAAGASSTLNFMNTFWVNLPSDGTNEEFWEHEWATHGTCYNTLLPSCFSDYQTGAEAVAFFQTVQRVFEVLPTYNWLASAGITPDSSATHTRDELQSALREAAGVTPELECNGNDLNAVYWFFNLQGSVVDGKFIPIDAPASSQRGGNCPTSGILYQPKGSSGFQGSTRRAEDEL